MVEVDTTTEAKVRSRQVEANHKAEEVTTLRIELSGSEMLSLGWTNTPLLPSLKTSLL